MKYASLVAVLLFCLSACEQDLPVAPQAMSADLSDAEYAVLAAAVQPIISDFRELGAGVQPTFIMFDSTWSEVNLDNFMDYQRDSADVMSIRYLLQFQKKIPVLEEQTVVDFVWKNHAQSYIKYPSKIHRQLIRASEAMQPGHPPSVTRIGFNLNGQQALASVGCWWGGYYFVLSKKSDSWVIVGSLTYGDR